MTCGAEKFKILKCVVLMFAIFMVNFKDLWIFSVATFGALLFEVVDGF